MDDDKLFTISFVFQHAVVTTSVTGTANIVPRAKAQLKDELGIDCDKAQEVTIHEHP